MTGAAPGIRIVEVDGNGSAERRPWSLQDRITAFSLSLQATAGDRLVLTAHNDDLALFGHAALQHGTTLDVCWGYRGQLAGPRRVHFEDFEGATELALEFSGAERPLNQLACTQVFAEKTVGEVVREVARANGFEAERLHVDDPSQELGTVTQAAETDAALLQRLAKQHGFEFFIDAAGLHWKKPRKSAQPVVVVRYGVAEASALSLHVASHQRRKAGRVEVRGRDPMEKRPLAAKATGATVNRDTLAETVEVVDPDAYETARQKENATVAVHPSGATTPAEAEAEAAARFQASEASSLELRVSVVGDPTLEARQVIRLETPSAYLNGNYYVHEARHVINGSGYVTELTLKRDGGGRQHGPSAAPQGGLRNDKRASSPDEPYEVVDPERALAQGAP
ncbi:MAG TPA: contractile injection system protein, VgrG/Pvc8 family [Myxococcota bacterium]|nr:contractile injection system protein, VgrG/Pvc8 family [Myxococcota bacterium]